MARTLDDLEPSEFERLINDLLLAEYGPRGRFIPFATPSGVTDGGHDASFDGPFRGSDAHWVVSVKHIGGRVRTPSVLKDRLGKELAGRRWWIVTNITVRPTAPIHTWLTEHAPGSEIMSREELDLLLDKHAWIKHHYSVHDGRGFDLFRPGSGISRPSLPIPRERELEKLVHALDRGANRVLVAGPRTADVAGALAHDAYRSGGVGHRVPVWVEVQDAERLAGLVGESLRKELTPDAVQYLFVVPPSPVADRAARLLASIPGSHAIVAFLAPIQAEEFPEHPPWTQVRLDPLIPDEMRDWVRQLRPASREDIVAAVVAMAGDQPETAASLVLPDRGMPELRDRIGEILDRAPGSRKVASEALAWLILLLPIARTDDMPEVVAASQRAGLLPLDVERLLEHAVTEHLVSERHGLWSERSPVLAAALVQRVVRGPAARRYEQGIRSLPNGLRWRGALRLARFTELDGPLVTEVALLAEVVATSDFTESQRALRAATDVARLSAKLAQQSWTVAQRAVERACRRDGFADWPDRMREFLPQQFVTDAARLVTAIGWWTERVDDAVSAIVELSASGSLVEPEKIGADLADPLHPRFEPVDRLLEVLSARLEAAPEVVGALVAGAAGKLLADGVHVSGTVGRTMRFGVVRWNEDQPRVGVRRGKLVDLLVRMTRQEAMPARRIGWKALAKLWDAESGFGTHAEPPDSVRALAEVGLVEAERAFSAASDWEDWSLAEHLVLRYVAKKLAEPGRLGRTIRQFRTDPDYQAWRILAHQSSFVADPTEIAQLVEGGGGWKAVVPRLSKYHRSAATAVAARVAAHIDTIDGVLRLLGRVASLPGAGWTGPDALLRDWIRLRQDLFRPLVLGDDWPRIPVELQSMVVHASLPVFGEELARRVTGPVIGGKNLGAGLQLAELLRRPTETDDREAARMLPALVSVLPVSNRAGALFALAAHPGRNTRHGVALQLADWLQFRAPKPDERDATAIVDRLSKAGTTGPSPEPPDPDPAIRQLAEDLAHWPDFGAEDPATAPPALKDAVDVAVGWAIVASIAHGAWWLGLDSTPRFLEAAIRSDQRRWLETVTAVMGRRVRDLGALSPPIGEDAHVRSILDWARLHGGVEAWEDVLEPPAKALSSSVLCELVQERLAAGHRDEAVLLFSFADPWGAMADPSYLAALEDLVGSGTTEDVRAVVCHVAVTVAGGAYGLGDGAPSQGEQAKQWALAARNKKPSLAAVMRRIAGEIDGIVQGLMQSHGL